MIKKTFSLSKRLSRYPYSILLIIVLLLNICSVLYAGSVVAHSTGNDSVDLPKAEPKADLNAVDTVGYGLSDFQGLHKNLTNPPYTTENLSTNSLPNIFVFEPALRSASDFSIWDEVTVRVEQTTHDKYGRQHQKESYDDIFNGVFTKKPGDLIVLLFSLDTKERIPEDYEDLLPEPWTEIEADLQEGKTVELKGEARDSNIILLAAPKRQQFKQLIRETKLLGLEKTAQQVTYNKTGRFHYKKSYDSIFKEGIWGKKPGDTVVLLFSLDTDDRIPAEYEDLLPVNWQAIESALKEGKTLEIKSKAREMNIIVLAAPNQNLLDRLIKESSFLKALKTVR
jgi:hypothetical protein